MDARAMAWADTVSLIPIEVRGKKPLIEWKEYTTRRATREERAAWRKRWPDCNWALVTGRISNCVALDFDGPQGKQLFDEHQIAGTAPVNVTAKGFHALYQVPVKELKNAVRIVDGLDVRSDSGYVLVAPSTHPSGTKYQWQLPPWVLPPPPFPDWAMELTETKAAAERVPVPVTVNPSFTEFAQGIGLIEPIGGWIADGTIRRCDAITPDGTVGRGDGSYKIFPDEPQTGFGQNFHRQQNAMIQWKPGTTEPRTITNITTHAPITAITVDKPSIGPKATLFASLSTLLAHQRPQRWLVKGLIEAPSTVLIFGPSGGGKSFVAVDLAGATATGGQWAGRDVVGGPVFYICGEGKTGLIRRFKAWQLKRKMQIPDPRMYLSVVRIEMNVAGAAEVEQEVERRAKEIGEPPALLILDTLARTMPSGSDENSAKDMMAFVNAVDQVRDRFNCVAVIVHHAGIADDKRARGSTSLKAAMDAELCITKRGAIRTAEWTKLKDLPEEPHPQEFALESELLGQDDDGNLITSAVVEWKGRTAVKTTAKITGAEDLALETLKTAVAGGDDASLEGWRREFYAKSTGDDSEAKKKAFQRVRASLAQKGFIAVNNDRYLIRGK